MAAIKNNTLFFSRFQLTSKNAADYEGTFVPLKGELCIESDTKKAKLGDGITQWSALDYYIDAANVTSTLADHESRIAAVEAFDTRISALETFKSDFDAITTLSANPAPADETPGA